MRWRTEKGWLREGVKAGGVSAAANRDGSLPTYGVLVYVGVRYSNASRTADWESERASPAWIVHLESSKHKALQKIRLRSHHAAVHALCGLCCYSLCDRNNKVKATANCRSHILSCLEKNLDLGGHFSSCPLFLLAGEAGWLAKFADSLAVSPRLPQFLALSQVARYSITFDAYARPRSGWLTAMARLPIQSSFSMSLLEVSMLECQ